MKSPARHKYLDKAVEFADAIMERQFTDWEHPIEGCFGTFYEFEGNNQAFFHEFMQGGFWWEGNVEALNLEGFMQSAAARAPATPRPRHGRTRSRPMPRTTPAKPPPSIRWASIQSPATGTPSTADSSISRTP